jgi:hypothetical protein
MTSISKNSFYFLHHQMTKQRHAGAHWLGIVPGAAVLWARA